MRCVLTSQPGIHRYIDETPFGTLQKTLEEGRNLIGDFHPVDLIHGVLNFGENLEEIVSRGDRVRVLREDGRGCIGSGSRCHYDYIGEVE